MHDRSKKGSIDRDIETLLGLINKIPGYKTTSSCSGRITVMEKPDSEKKNESTWLYKTHDPDADREKVYALQSEKPVWLILEPLIIHIECKNLEKAKKMLSLINNSGLKRSGVISLSRFVIQAESSERMHVPLWKNDREYTDRLCEIANRKLSRTKERIKKLELVFEKF